MAERGYTVKADDPQLEKSRKEMFDRIDNSCDQSHRIQWMIPATFDEPLRPTYAETKIIDENCESRA